MDEQAIREIVRAVLSAPKPQGNAGFAVPVEVSARHVHLTQEALQALFGKGAELNMVHPLSQGGEFLSDKRVKLVTSKGELKNVAVLGPLRAAVQAELSLTDTHALGLAAPVNLSGDLTNAADVLLVGEAGNFEARGSVIVAKAHIHLTPKDAEELRVSNGQRVCLRIKGAREATLSDVIVRVQESFTKNAHIDLDEANACGISGKAEGYVMPGAAAPAPHLQSAAATIAESAVPAGETASFSGKLLTEAEAKSFRGCKTLRIAHTAIVTPAAQDILSSAHVRVERE